MLYCFKLGVNIKVINECGDLRIKILRTLVSDAYIVTVLRNYSFDSLVNAVRYLRKLKDSYEVLVNLKTSAITVVIRGVRRVIVVPPFSFFIKCSNECRDLIGDLIDLGAYTYFVGEDSWIECKEFPTKVYALLDHPLNLLSQLGIKTSYLSKISIDEGINGCVLVSCNACLDSTVINDLLLKVGYIIDLQSIKGLNKVDVSGYLRSNFKDHPLIYGAELSEFHGSIYDVSSLRGVLTYGRSLMHVNSKPLIVEMPNRSLLFSGGFDSLTYFLLRALIYSC
ncbi:MAG: hypothetical protein QXO98_04410 [Sulfolobales archaeon]